MTSNTSHRLKLGQIGAALWMGCLQYFAGEALAILGFRGPYSLRTNVISDLGAVSCIGAFCSSRHALMNASFLLQGGLILSGALLIRTSFPLGRLWTAAIGLIGASGLGVSIVGLAPEDVAPGWHYFGAAENFLFSNTGAAVFGAALVRTKRGRAMGVFALFSGLLGLLGLAGVATHTDFGLGPGGIERVTAYPFAIWISCTGAWRLCARTPSKDDDARFAA